MPREIRFRAWDVYGKEMHAVKEIAWDDERPMNGLLDDNEGGLFRAYLNEDCLVDGKDPEYFILMQFTGLRDKNGREIYEGDILHDENFDGIGKVEWNKEHGYWQISFIDDFEHLGDYNRCSKVIGNIYENPELLK